MRNGVLTIMKKELARFFGDKRMVVSILMPGVLIYIMYAFMGNAMGSAFGMDEDYTPAIQAVSLPGSMEALLPQTGFSLITGTDEEAAQSARQVLVWVLGSTLKLLHPFMPFITEEIWQSLPHEGEALIVAPWPVYDEALHFPEAEKEMEKVKELITAVRTRRSEMNVPPSRKAHLYIETQSPAAFETEKEAIARLAYCSGVEIGESFAAMEGAVTVVTAACRGYLPMDDLIDRAAETARLTKELESAQKQLDTVNAKLQNETFMSKAPQKVIDGVKQNGEKLREKVRMIEESLAAFR